MQHLCGQSGAHRQPTASRHDTFVASSYGKNQALLAGGGNRGRDRREEVGGTKPEKHSIIDLEQLI